MQVFEREVFHFKGEDKEYFVTHVSLEYGKAAFVCLDEWTKPGGQFKKPLILSFQSIKDQLKSGSLVRNEQPVQLPVILLKPDKWLERTGHYKWLKKRDEKYNIIKSVVESPELLEKYIYRAGITEEILNIKRHTGEKSVGAIYRTLNRYIAYGCVKNALLPFKLEKCGNRTLVDRDGKPQEKRGRKTRLNASGQLVKVRSKTRAICKVDKERIVRILKARKIYNLKSFKKTTFEDIFNEFQDLYQSHIILRETSKGTDYYPWLHDEETRISEGQFRYHLDQLLSDPDRLRLEMGKVNFEKDKAVKTGLARDGIVGPGYCYAIDATVLDVYVRYPYNPEILTCGRPVLYIVVDVWSTCIVGYYIGFHGPDWAGAGEALYHACINKAEWARSIGWELAEDAWPCHHVPRIVFGDNGPEFSATNIMSMLKAEIGIEMMDYAPIFRGDAKSVVERIFGVLNTSFVHLQPGYVPTVTLRELSHASNDAVWSYQDLVKAIGREIIFHNNHADRLKLHNFLMAREDIGINPQALYNFGIEREMDGGRVIKDKGRLRFAFLREEEATVTGSCVTYKGIEYEYPGAKGNGMYARAKYHGSYSIPVRVTNCGVTYIWHRNDDGKIKELRIRDPDHWARDQRLEAVCLKMEEYRTKRHETEQEKMQARLQINFEHKIDQLINSAQLLNLPKTKGMPAGIKDAKDAMAAFNHQTIISELRATFSSHAGENIDTGVKAGNDVDELIYQNY